MSHSNDPLLTVGGKAPRGTVRVPIAWDDEPTNWRHVPREDAEQWDARYWR